MKKLFTILACAAAMVACENDEIVRQDLGDAIEFGSAHVDKATRADKATDPSLNNETFDNFLVWGTVTGGNGLVSIFGGDAVTGTVGYVDPEADPKVPNVWTCRVKQYWIEGATYNFAALANAEKINVTLGDDKLPASVVFTSTGSTDLVYSKIDAPIVGKATGQNGPVNLTFEHLLSKVKFTVTNNSTAAEGYSFEITGIKVTASTKGTCALPAKTWSGFNEATAQPFANIVIAVADPKEECAAEKLFIPGEVKVDFTVEIKKDGTTIGKKVHTQSTHALEVGHAYNFGITVAVGEEITFSVTEAPAWDEPNSLN